MKFLRGADYRLVLDALFGDQAYQVKQKYPPPGPLAILHFITTNVILNKCGFMDTCRGSSSSSKSSSSSSSRSMDPYMFLKIIFFYVMKNSAEEQISRIVTDYWLKCFLRDWLTMVLRQFTTLVCPLSLDSNMVHH